LLAGFVINGKTDGSAIINADCYSAFMSG